VFVQRGERDAQARRCVGHLKGTRHAEDVAQATLLEQGRNPAHGVDGSAAMPQANDHARLDQIDRVFGGLLLELGDVHALFCLTSG
jgi:hypothetical protein